MSTNAEAISRDKALMMLNDRCGQRVEVAVRTDAGYLMVMSVLGTLTHWRQDPTAAGWGDSPRDDVTGLYHVQGASLNTTEMSTARQLPNGLAFELAEDVTLTIEWAAEPA